MLLQHLVEHVRSSVQPLQFSEDTDDHADLMELFPTDIEAEVAERCFRAHLPAGLSDGVPPWCRYCRWPDRPLPRLANLTDDVDHEFAFFDRDTRHHLLGLGDLPRAATARAEVAVQTRWSDFVTSLLNPLPSFSEPYSEIPRAPGGVCIRSADPDSPANVMMELWSDELARMLHRLHSGLVRIGELHPQYSRGLDEILLP